MFAPFAIFIFSVQIEACLEQRKIRTVTGFDFYCSVLWTLTMIDTPHVACWMLIILLLFIIIKSFMQSFFFVSVFVRYGWRIETAHHTIYWALSAAARLTAPNQRPQNGIQIFICWIERSWATKRAHKHIILSVYMIGPSRAFFLPSHTFQ